MQTQKEIEQKLSKYTKQEIISALSRCFPVWMHIDSMIRSIEYYRKEDVLERHRKAIDEENEATKDYINWKHEVVEKYGSDGEVKLMDLPMEELERGAEIENRLAKARETERRLSKEVDRILGLKGR